MNASDRVFLRAFEPSDAVRLFEIESQPEMVRYQEFEPRTMESAQLYVHSAIRDQGDSYVELAICDHQDAEFIGRVGAAIKGEAAWIWYVVDPEYQGRGFAKQSVSLFLRRLVELGIRAAHIECDPRNVPSWTLAEALGFELLS